MKQHKTMITLLAVLVVCIGLYFVMGAVSKKQAEKEMEEDIMVTNLVSLVSLEYTDGTNTLSFVKEDGTWYVAEDKDFALDSSQVEAMESSLAAIMAVRKLDGADGLEAYGLDEPTYTVSMKDENGKETTLYIGDSMDENVYATVDDKAVVYTISATTVDAMEFDLANLEVVEEET